MKSFLEAGLNPEIFFVRDAASIGDSEKFSISSPDMNHAVLIIILKYLRL